MRKKILIIEDNEHNIYLFSFLLEKNGYEVVKARDGRQGLAKAAEELPDLILLDILLPLMDGYAVARELRKNPDLSDIPVLVVTSYSIGGDCEETIPANCAGYIVKPIDPKTFLTQVEKFISCQPPDPPDRDLYRGGDRLGSGFRQRTERGCQE